MTTGELNPKTIGAISLQSVESNNPQGLSKKKGQPLLYFKESVIQ